MYVCMYVCVFMYVCMYVCMYVYVCVCVCMYVCARTWIQDEISDFVGLS
jgi:hypothetical protein